VRVGKKEIVLTQSKDAYKSVLDVCRFAESLARILKSANLRPNQTQAISNYEVSIPLPGMLSERLLRNHLATSIPAFFEQAEVAAQSVLKRSRGTTKNNGRVCIQILTIRQKDR
jgi:hypothetical protein